MVTFDELEQRGINTRDWDRIWGLMQYAGQIPHSEKLHDKRALTLVGNIAVVGTRPIDLRPIDSARMIMEAWNGPACECAMEKFNFMFHERWCPEYRHAFDVATTVVAPVDYRTVEDRKGGA